MKNLQIDPVAVSGVKVGGAVTPRMMWDNEKNAPGNVQDSRDGLAAWTLRVGIPVDGLDEVLTVFIYSATKPEAGDLGTFVRLVDATVYVDRNGQLGLSCYGLEPVDGFTLGGS